MEDWTITGVIMAALSGVWVWFLQHITSDKHPSKDAIVYKDVCEAKMKGINDCIEAKFDSIKETIDRIETKLDNMNQL